jgi:hypothetical protein
MSMPHSDWVSEFPRHPMLQGLVKNLLMPDAITLHFIPAKIIKKQSHRNENPSHIICFYPQVFLGSETTIAGGGGCTDEVLVVVAPKFTAKSYVGGEGCPCWCWCWPSRSRPKSSPTRDKRLCREATLEGPSPNPPCTSTMLILRWGSGSSS